MITLTSIVLGLLASLSSATYVTLDNNCNYQVDAAFFPTVGFNQSQTGGFALTSAHPSATVLLADNYDGQIWGRTGCDANGNCYSGGCPGGESCTGPLDTYATIARFQLNATNGEDEFGANDGLGFNIPLTIAPGPGCSVGPVDCTNWGNEGNGCGDTFNCPTTVAYTVTFC